MIGLSDLEFGMDRGRCRDLLGERFTSFSRTGNEFQEVDEFTEVGLQLNFDRADRLELIEVFEPADAQFGGVSMIGRQLSAVTTDLGRLGLSGIPESTGADYRSVGLSLYAPAEVIEAIGVYSKGYYDQDG